MNTNSYTYSVTNLNQGSYYSQVGKIYMRKKDFRIYYYPYIDIDRVYFGNNNNYHLDKYYYLQYFHRDMNFYSYTNSVRILY